MKEIEFQQVVNSEADTNDDTLSGRSVQITEESDVSLDLWRNRTFWQDITQTWLTPFVNFSCSVEKVKVEHL